MKTKHKIIVACVCVACLLSAVILTCSANAVTPTSLRWCDYVKYEDTGEAQYIGKNGFDGFDVEQRSDYINTYYMYFNDITLPFNGLYADETNVPRMVLRDDDGTIPGSMLDIYGEFYFSYYAYDSESDSEIVQSVRLDVEVVGEWNNDSEEYTVWDITEAVENALLTQSGVVIDGLWVSISNFSLAIDVVSNPDVVGSEVYSVGIETDLLTNVYHGSLIPLDVPLGSGGGFTQEDINNAFGRGFDEGKQEGLDEGYSDGYDEGYDIGFERGEDKGYTDGYNDGVKVDANIGAFLVSTVGDFLGLPILGDDFTVGHILLIVVTIPLVVWFLKLFAGG